jgi:integrase
MAFVTKPRFGRNFRITKRGYIDGIFVIDGVRVFKGLCRVADIERQPSGRPRTAKQLNAAVQHLWEQKRELLESGEEKRRGINRSIGETFDEWLAWAPHNGIGAETVEKHYRLLARQYLSGVGNHLLADFDIGNVDRFKAWLHQQGLGPVTVNMRLTRLQTFLNWARKRGYLDEVPTIEKLKVKKKVPRIPNGEQIKALVQRLQHLATTYPNRRQRYHYELHWMELLFVLGCRVRRSGPFYTRWEHVDLDSGVMLMERSKGGEDLLILPDLLIAYLKARRERYKAGLVFLAYLNGHQPHFHLLDDLEQRRDMAHYGELFRLADAAGVLADPPRAYERFRPLLEAAGYRAA